MPYRASRFDHWSTGTKLLVLLSLALFPLGLALACMAGVGALMWFGGEAIASAITDDPEVIAAATAIFAVFALTQIGDAVQSVMLGSLRGLSDTAFPATVSTVAYWVFGLPLGWSLATWGGQGAPGLWMGFLAALVGSGINQTALSVDWKGETAPAVQTGDSVKEPLNRRSTIDINF